MNNEIVEFRSTPENYAKEENGIKSNTVRKVDRSDTRWQVLNFGKVKQIRITNTNTGKSFIREISDITYWDEWWIISWQPQECIICPACKKRMCQHNTKDNLKHLTELQDCSWKMGYEKGKEDAIKLIASVIAANAIMRIAGKFAKAEKGEK